MRKRVGAVLDRLESSGSFDVFVPGGSKAEVVDDHPSLRRALDSCLSAGVDVLLSVQPVISDGRLAPALAQQWGHCVLLWATPEEQAGQMISGNSLVGAHLMAANLRQLGFPAQLVYGNLDWVLAEAQLLRGVGVAFAHRFLQKAKLGLVGYQAPGANSIFEKYYRLSVYYR